MKTREEWLREAEHWRGIADNETDDETAYHEARRKEVAARDRAEEADEAHDTETYVVVFKYETRVEASCDEEAVERAVAKIEKEVTESELKADLECEAAFPA